MPHSVSLTDKHIGRLFRNQETLNRFPGLKPYVTTVRTRSSCCGGGVSYRASGSASSIVRHLLDTGSPEDVAALKRGMGLGNNTVKFYVKDVTGALKHRVV